MSTVNEAQPTTSTTATDLASYQQFALEQQAQNNAWSAAQAQKQMDFQREMSNSAHTREVADLKAAGLNPILSVNSGASVPNGASGDTDTSAAANVGSILQQVLSAQSAREVAGMYNAATIAAATIAADASMYGSDMNYWNSEDHPKSVGEMLAREMLHADKMIPGERVFEGEHNPSSGKTGHHDPYYNNYTANNKTGINQFISSRNVVNIMKSYGLKSGNAQKQFLTWLSRRPHVIMSSVMKNPLSMMSWIVKFAKTSIGRNLMSDWVSR